MSTYSIPSSSVTALPVGARRASAEFKASAKSLDDWFSLPTLVGRLSVPL